MRRQDLGTLRIPFFWSWRPVRSRELCSSFGAIQSGVLTAYQVAWKFGLLAQGIGLRPQPWAGFCQPVGPVLLEALKGLSSYEYQEAPSEGAARSATMVTPTPVAVWTRSGLPPIEAAALFPAALQEVSALATPGASVCIFPNFLETKGAGACASIHIRVGNSNLDTFQLSPLVHGAHQITNREQSPAIILRVAGVAVSVSITICLVGVESIWTIIVEIINSIPVRVCVLARFQAPVIFLRTVALAATLGASIISF